MIASPTSKRCLVLIVADVLCQRTQTYGMRVRSWVFALSVGLCVCVVTVPASARPQTGQGALWEHAQSVDLIWEKSREVPLLRLEQAQRACVEIFSQLPAPSSPLRIYLRQAENAQDFQQRTGRPTFEAAAVLGQTIWLQSEPLFSNQADVDAIFRHECVHLWFRTQHQNPLPLLLEEVLALGLSGQAARIPPRPRLEGEECEKAERDRAQPQTRAAYETWLHRAVATFWGAISQMSPDERRRWLGALSTPEKPPLHAQSTPAPANRTSSCERLWRYLPPVGTKK